MANLTITIDDRLLHRARVRAAELGTSVNAVLRDYVERWVDDEAARRQAVDSLLEHSKKARGARGGARWTRDELHDR